MGQLQPITIHEQQQLELADQEYVNNLELPYYAVGMGDIPPYLGLSADGWSSYYVGAAWLKEGHRPLVVLPKYDKIDFLRIFSDALADDVAPSYFEEAYKINFNAPTIEESSLNSVLTPLMVAHFISIVKKLLKRGLKRNYIIREENLKSKVRGHILPLRNLQKNILRGHAEMVLCRFQEYSIDYPENQLIKRALLASESLLLGLKSKSNSLLFIIRRMITSFEGVSSDITPSAVKTIRRDKLHGEYPQAVELAKRILRRTDFSISENSATNQFVPEFAVDMSRIFEFHVLSLLKQKFQKEEVLFQVYAGIMGRCDYIVPSEKIVIDAKYKPLYAKNKSNLSSYDRDAIRTDIREVSGYCRSNVIREKLGVEGQYQPNCLIVYPNGIYSNNDTIEGPLLEKASAFDGISGFYKLGVSLPKI